MFKPTEKQDSDLLQSFKCLLTTLSATPPIQAAPAVELSPIAVTTRATGISVSSARFLRATINRSATTVAGQKPTNPFHSPSAKSNSSKSYQGYAWPTSLASTELDHTPIGNQLIIEPCAQASQKSAN
jgi:hypothetical protein